MKDIHKYRILEKASKDNLPGKCIEKSDTIWADQIKRIWWLIDMGRTVPSFRMLLEGIIGELSDFRRALREKTELH